MEGTMVDEGRADGGNGSSGNGGSGAPESTAAVRQELAATRERMSETIAELEQRVSGRIDAVKQKVDVVALVKQHPWPSLAVAFVAGVALSASGADRKAAMATARVAKHAPETAKRGATQAVSATSAGVSRLARAAAERFRGTADDVPADNRAEASAGTKAKAAGVFGAPIRELREEMKRGADELSNAAPPPRRNAGI
jgi:ElaB/YqjD/DUF883 family membrane-anchored ribosome-binding protein